MAWSISQSLGSTKEQLKARVETERHDIAPRNHSNRQDNETTQDQHDLNDVDIMLDLRITDASEVYELYAGGSGFPRRNFVFELTPGTAPETTEQADGTETVSE